MCVGEVGVCNECIRKFVQHAAYGTCSRIGALELLVHVCACLISDIEIRIVQPGRLVLQSG